MNKIRRNIYVKPINREFKEAKITHAHKVNVVEFSFASDLYTKRALSFVKTFLEPSMLKH